MPKNQVFRSDRQKIPVKPPHSDLNFRKTFKTFKICYIISLQIIKSCDLRMTHQDHGIFENFENFRNDLMNEKLSKILTQPVQTQNATIMAVLHFRRSNFQC